jgi:hypothetical protein
VILVEDTIRKFGYDPTTMGPWSLRHVVRKCDKCGKIEDADRRDGDRPCRSCSAKGRWVRHKARAEADPTKAFWIKSKGATTTLICTNCGTHEENASVGRTLCLGCSRSEAAKLIAAIKRSWPKSSVAVKETKVRFGYDPSLVKKATRRPVVKACGVCGEMRATKWDDRLKLCLSCASHLDQDAKAEGFAAFGLTPRGTDPSTLKKNGNEHQRAFQANRRVTEVGRVRGILYATLGQFRAGRLEKSRNLPYTALQLHQHLSSEIEKYHGVCPMCSASFSTVGFDIDHKTPTCLCKTVEQMKAAFELSNLSVLCKDCNRRVKRAKALTYDEIRSIQGGATVVRAINVASN